MEIETESIRLDIFWKHVDKEDPSGCWIWKGTVHKGGYGQYSNNATAHRISYTLANGPIPTGMFVCHTCDNKLCVKPDHLWIGTPADNMRDRDRKGRQAKGDRHATVLHPGMNAGEHNGRSILNWEKVREIRKLYSQGLPRNILAEKYGVAWSTMNQVVNGEHWQEKGPTQ